MSTPRSVPVVEVPHYQHVESTPSQSTTRTRSNVNTTSAMDDSTNPKLTMRKTRSSMTMGGYVINNEENLARSRGASNRTSIASESMNNSRYSTPLTSVPSTPLASKEDESTSKYFGRPARSAAKSRLGGQMLVTVDANKRATDLQNSKYSLNPGNSMFGDFGKPSPSEDRDAQLARQLQDEEDANGGMGMMGGGMDSELSDIDADDDYTMSTFSKAAKGPVLATIKGKKNRKTLKIDSSDEDDDIVEPPTKRSRGRGWGVTSKTELLASVPPNSIPEWEPSQPAVKAYGRARKAATPKVEDEVKDSEDDEPLITKRPTRRAAKRTILDEGGETSEAEDSNFDISNIVEESELSEVEESLVPSDDDEGELPLIAAATQPTRSNRTPGVRRRRGRRANGNDSDDSNPYGLDERTINARLRLEHHHPELLTMWKDLENLPAIPTEKAEQPKNISRVLKPFQLEGLNWMKMMEKTQWGGGLLGDEMGMGKTIQAVSLIISDYPQPQPSLVLIPPVALGQWQSEIKEYTDGTLRTLVYHGTNSASKNMTMAELRKYDVILMSYNSLESLYRFQEKGRSRKDKDTGKMVTFKQPSIIHQTHFHRVILDEAHNIKQRTTGAAKACFALKADHRWCLSGTPLQNRIGEFFSLIRFLDVKPFANYCCRQCPCSHLEWRIDSSHLCTSCGHHGMQHVSIFNQELLNPIQKYGNKGPGKEAFRKLRLLTGRFMLRRVKVDHSSAMELPAKEIYVDRKFFGEEENDFAGSIMHSGQRKFDTYVAQGVLLNNYANIFGLIMQMRQVADHPDLILKKDGEGGQNVICCCICDEAAEDAVRSACKHEFCRSCVKGYIKAMERNGEEADCPRCHIGLSVDLEQPEIVQDEGEVKKTSIINRINMSKWTSSSKIEALVYELHLLRSKNQSHKSIIFSSFTTMLQLVEWRLRRAGITTVMLDGSMTPAQRTASISAFMTDPTIECFLVSLKAGGVALNLTEASRVFLVDPWWNPAAEWQSADRCHRIGQCRPCTITRLCIEDSVESRMVLLQEKKSNMIRSTINNDEAAMESLTPEDMQFLFRGT